MQVFIMNDTVQQELTKLRTYAEQHPFTRAEMEARQLVDNWAPGNSADYSREFTPATKVVFTIEPTQSGKQVCHMSVSVNGRMPHPFVVTDLMPWLGFTGNLTNCLVDFSEDPVAINIYQSLT